MIALGDSVLDFFNGWRIIGDNFDKIIE